jgi:hypothetical protein
MGIVAEFESANWVTEDAVSTVPNVTCSDGDVLVASAICGNQLRTLGISGGGLTWTPRGAVSATARCSVTQWTAVVGAGQGGTFAVTATFSGDGIGGLSVLAANGIDAIGASVQADAAGPTAPSTNISTAVDNAIIVVAVGDHATVDGAARAWRTDAGALTETTYSRVDFSNAAYVGYHADAGAAGSKTIGLTAPATMRPSIVAVELQPATEDPVVEGTAAGVAGGASGTVTADAVVVAAAAGVAGGASGTAAGEPVVVAAAGGVAGGASGAVTAVREVVAELSGTAAGAVGHVTAEGGSGGLLHPSSTQVAVAWLRQVLGLPAAATLPAVDGWFDTGFVTVPATVGGNPNWYITERQPIMQIDAWAANRAAAGAKSVSRLPPLSRANQLADAVVYGTYTHEAGVLLTLPDGFKDVWLETVFPVSEIRRIPEQSSGYAHFSVDIAMMWIERDPVI